MYNIPPHDRQLLPCWNATIGLDAAAGTIMRTVDVDEETIEVYILTTYHSVRGHTDDVPTDLYRHEQYRTNSQNDKVIPLSRRFEWVAKDAGADLALIRVKIEKKNQVEKSGPSAIWGQYELSFDDKKKALHEIIPPAVGNCASVTPGAPVYGFGYPLVPNRPRPKSIPNPDTVEKRWSVGQVSGRTIPGDFRTAQFAITTNDQMKGNSGGAVCNQSGEIVGVLSGAIVPPGDPFGQSYNAKTLVSSCERMRKILESNLPH